MKELKPCKCGNKEIKIGVKRGAMSDVFDVVYCEKCLLRTNGSWGEEHSINEWNAGVFSMYKHDDKLLISTNN